MSFSRLIKNEIFRISIGAILLIFGVILGQFGFSVISVALRVLALAVCGLDVFLGAVKGILRGDVFDENDIK